jgi:N-acetylneuraminic acid mutarotase
LNDGGIYDPATNIWLPINLIGAPSAGRSGHSAVWTGSKMIVWGGAGNFSTQRNLNDGGLYDPTTNSWQPLNVNGAPSGRNGHKAFWTGTKMIIWGGWNQLNSGAETLLNNGGLYDPGTNAWQPLNVNGAPSGRYLSSAIWTGSKMIVWGGSGPNGIGTFNNGGIYDPTTNTWQSINLIGAPSARAGHSAVWTGSKMIIWGGNINRITFNDGGIYDPLTNTWQPIGLNGSPSGRYDHTSVWTGSKMIVWGGTESVNGSFIRRDNGGIYDPLSNSWQPLNLSGVPSVRTVPSALWTGSKMVIWGGYTTGGQLNTGGVFE